MNGATITLKNVPEELHRSLKEQAKKHKRSLNMEAIQCLEAAMAQSKGESGSLRNPPPSARVGRILSPLGNRAEREEDFLTRGG